ncbi:MAG: PA2779 family protein [Nitrospirae bacterium]|nr:PA2779 family protein [Nitrospirota bacterium]
MFRHVGLCLVFTMLLFAAVPRVEGAMLGSEFIGLSPAERQVDIGKLQRFLESEVVGKRLQALGFTADEVAKRLDSLSDEDLSRFAQQVDQLRVAGDSGLGIIISLLVIAILVVLLLQLTGHRVVIVK